MLKWYYREKIAKVYIKQKIDNKTYKWKGIWYGGNAPFIVTTTHIVTEKSHYYINVLGYNVGDVAENLYTFGVDRDHLIRCLKDGVYNDIYKIVFYKNVNINEKEYGMSKLDVLRLFLKYRKDLQINI